MDVVIGPRSRLRRTLSFRILQEPIVIAPLHLDDDGWRLDKSVGTLWG